MFVRNAWYVAARSDAVGPGLHATRLLGDAVVLYRKLDGSVVALEDACPHRKLPLSMGRLKGEHVECGYHGLTFDGAGTCVRAPGNARIPPGARVRSYPAHERYGLVWLWMGPPEHADSAAIIEVPEWGDSAWGINQGDAMTVDCHYLYVTDNLLDPSHVAWVHPSSFGNAACEGEPLSTLENGKGVMVSRWMRNAEVAPFYARYVKFSGRCDRKQQYEVRFPSHAVIKAIFTPAGTGSESGPMHPDVFLMNSYNFLTPVDESTTRYYWFQARNFDQSDALVSEQFNEDVRHAFDEDRVILAAVHAGMANRRTPNINLALDAGPTRFRRGVQRLIDAEQRDNAEQSSLHI
jgi:phenylpropionate dioxygenase-like ring-hydroxylating dioxygenase large terminal subunit